jgi:plasmid maintenance system antidote protein VapI
MVTRIHSRRPPQLFIKEWQEHWGITPSALAARIGVTRESYYRLLREPPRITIPKLHEIAYAMGHGMTAQDFFRPPQRPSMDAMIENAPEDLQRTAVDIVKRLVGRNH